MTRPDQRKYPISQYFGGNPQIYSQFGLQGHNGWDIGTSTGTVLVSPHDGKVTEIGNDTDGYGIYLKIENDIEGSLLAHNKETLVNLGQSVVEGQAVAVSNNTGFSTGPHSHWGYFRKPRDRTNGYNGYIDQTSYLEGNVIIPPMNDQTKIPKALLGEDQDLEIQAVRGLLKDGKRDNLDLIDCRIELKECQESPQKPPKTFNSPLGKLLYRLALKLG